jgi:DNA-binding LytR/AlgR family response regulator
MLNTIIIEDERPSRESLLQTLARISADVNLLATITSVQEGISYLDNPEMLILFSAMYNCRMVCLLRSSGIAW